ncbi:MAG: CsgE family curli-type amyloid fiber assembly protein [Bacteroidota bacterium]
MLKLIQHIAILLGLLLMSLSSVAQIYNTQIEAKIDINANSEFVEFTGSAFNKTEISQSLRYSLSVIRKDPVTQKSLKNDQTGRFVLDPGRKQNLTKATLNANETERVIILLLIYSTDDSLLGMDRIVVNGTEADARAAGNDNVTQAYSKNAVNNEPDGVVLRGIVIEETKTKPGRDFYNLFYSDYLKYKINGEKIVTIKETLSLANNTKIEVIAGDTKVLEFFVRPQPDYLKTLSTEAIKRVYGYFKDLREGKYIVKHY